MNKPLIQLHIAVFLWGFTGILGKLITLNEGWLVWYRILFTIIILFFVLLYKKQLVLLNAKSVLQLGATGVVIALHWVAFFGSIKYSNVSVALTCFSSTGPFTALIEPLFYKKKIKAREVGLGMLGICGIYLIFHFEPDFKTGILLGILAALLSALFAVINKKLVETYTPEIIMFYELSGGYLILSALMPLYISTQMEGLQFIWPSWMDTFWLLILSGLCTVFAMHISLKALKHISAFTQNIVVNLEPVYAIIMAFIFFNEASMLDAGFYAGLSLIVLSVLIQMRAIMK